MIDDLRVRGKACLESADVTGADRARDAGAAFGRRVVTHAARGTHRLGRQRVEACERFGRTVGVELLAMRDASIASEHIELDAVILVRPSAGANRAEIRRPGEQRGGLEAE